MHRTSGESRMQRPDTTKLMTLGVVVSAFILASAAVQADDSVQTIEQAEKKTNTAEADFSRTVGSNSELTASTHCGVSVPSVGCCPEDSCSEEVWWAAVVGDEPLLGDHRHISVGDCLTATVGGSIRYRFMNEADRLRPGGPGRSTYDLWRITPYAELKYGDSITGYILAIDASIFNEELPVTGIEWRIPI